MPYPELIKKILVVDPIHTDAINLLQTHGFLVDVNLFPSLSELPALASQYDIMICRTNTKLSADFFSSINRLQCVALASTGYDQIDLKSASKHHVTILGLPSDNPQIDVRTHGNFISTAEHTMLMILAALRDFYNASASMKAGQWEKPKFVGTEAYQKTLGFIGFGRIARLVATRAQAFGMHTIAFDPYTSDETMMTYQTTRVSKEQLCTESDIITIHAPKTPETINLLDASAFSLMKPGVILINAARSEIVNHAALTTALNDNTIARLAMDVFTNEPYDIEWDLVSDDKVIPTPHIGGSTTEAQRRIALSTANSIISFVNEHDTSNVINKK